MVLGEKLILNTMPNAMMPHAPHKPLPNAPCDDAMMPHTIMPHALILKRVSLAASFAPPRSIAQSHC